MAYKGYEFKDIVGTRESMWAYIQSFMIEIGWTLHDSISETVKVYKSNGESGKEPYGYVWMDAGTSTYIQLRFYQYWDEVNHVGYRNQTGVSDTYQRIGSFSTARNILAGDKDLVYLGVCIEKNYAGIIFGHLPVRFDNTLSYAMGTAGTAATLLVSDSTNFGAGKYIQVVGSGTEGCEPLQVQEVIDSENIIVTKLQRNYGTGSVIGAPASVFGYSSYPSYYNRWYQVSHYSDSGTSVDVLKYVPIAYESVAAQDHFSKMKVVKPVLVLSDSATDVGIILGGYGTHFIWAYLAAAPDILGRNNSGEYGTASTATTGGVSGTTSFLIDERASWTTDIHTDRFVAIESGTGAGQLNKVTGNDATSLSLHGTFGTSFGTSKYKIFDMVWRECIYLGGGNAGVRITDTVAPEIP